jgi:oxygen-dependent protoporphyrinogen oxidase
MIIIIGGGISGLAAAHELRRRGTRFLLLEASSRAGGLIRTEQRDGFTIDAGADSMLANKPAALAFCDELGLSPALQDMQEPRVAYVLAGERLHPLPTPSILGLPLTFGATVQFTLLPWYARLRVLLERCVRPGQGEDESVAAFFTRRFGASATELIAQPLLGGIHAGDVGALSIRALFPHLTDAERTGGVLRSLRTSRARGGFVSLAGGMETLPRAVAHSLPADAVRYRAEVQTVTAASDGWLVTASDGSERAAAVVFAVPMPVTARLLRSVAPEAAGLCAGIPHASSVSVALAWPRDAIPHPLRGSGFVVARTRSRVRITACTWVSSKWEGRARSGQALLRAFLGGVQDPGAVDLSDEELIAAASGDLARVLGISHSPALASVYRWRDASPQLNVGHDARVRRIVECLDAHAGIFVTGRGFRAVGIPDCIGDARRVAAAAAEFVARRAAS